MIHSHNDFAVKKILIIGISGGLARITAKNLHQYFPEVEIVGIDPRPLPAREREQLPRLKFIQMEYSRGLFENLFRDHQFDVVLHLARMTHVTAGLRQDLAKRLDLSVMGTNKIVELCLRTKVKKLVVQSTFHVYGALPDNPIFLKEDDPLRASIKYSDLRDVVNLDQIATSLMWQHQNELSFVVLRPCNIIGPQIKNAISKFLVYPHSPYPIDFNPRFQFIHEFDMANILCRSIKELPSGVFNVASDEFISIQEALQGAGSPGLPVPMSLASPLVFFFKKVWGRVPEYLIDYLKYSCLIDNSELKRHLGPHLCRFSTSDALALLHLD